MSYARLLGVLCCLLLPATALRAQELPVPPPPPPLPQLCELPYAPTGLYFNVGVDGVRARLRDYGAPLDSLPLDYAAAPRFTLGIGLGGGMALQATYRYLSTSGPNGMYQYGPYLPPFDVHPRLEMNTLDLDLVGRELEQLGLVRTQWHVGVRLARVELETYSYPFPGVHARDSWSGVGGHLGPQVSVVLGNTGLALYGLGDVGFSWGSNHYDTWRFAPGHGPGSSDPRIIPTVASESLGAMQLRGEFGLSWTYCLERLRLRATAGYAWEWWFFPGLTNADGNYFDSPGTGIPMEGVFLKFEVQF